MTTLMGLIAFSPTYISVDDAAQLVCKQGSK